MRYLLLLLIPLLAGCAGEQPPANPPRPATFELRGLVVLKVFNVLQGPDWRLCQGLGPNSDIAEGSQVTVFSASGDIVGLTELGPPSGYDNGLGGCSYPFSAQVPDKGDEFYQVQLMQREKITVSADDAKAGQVQVTIR